MKRVILISMLSAVLGQHGATPGRALPECGTCVNGEFQHYFHGSGCGPLQYMCMDCNVFNACHGFLQDGYCTEFHWHCGTAAASADLLATLGGGGVEEVLRAHPVEAARYVNHARRALQVTDCRGAVVTHIPLNERQIALLTAAARMAA